MEEKNVVITIKQKPSLESDQKAYRTWEWTIDNIKEIKPAMFYQILQDIEDSLINKLAEDNGIPSAKVRKMLLDE